MSDDIKESRVLKPAQRRKLARNMKMRKIRLKRRRDIVEKRPPSKERVSRLAARKALKVLKKRFASKRGEDYKNLSISGKVAVDTIMANKLTKNKKIAQAITKRIIPKVRSELMKKRAEKMKSVNEGLPEEHGAGECGTDKLRKKYQKDTPGQKVKKYE